MERTLDNIQELGWKADNGCKLRTEVVCTSAVSVTAKYRKDEAGNEHADGYKATFIISSIRTDETIAIYEREFPTLDSLLDLLGIDDIDEVWEVLDP